MLWKINLRISESLFGPGDTLLANGACQHLGPVPFDGNDMTIHWSDTGNVYLIISHWPERDTIHVRFYRCWYQAYFPEAFSPDGDQHNDTWQPNFQYVDRVQWEVRSENNEFVYGTSDEDGRWDGTWNNRLAPPGLYQYYATFTTESGEEMEKHGWFELYR
jgi:gliding motility-associated-like protein